MTRGPYLSTKPMTKPWENRRKPPRGTCQRTIVEAGKARICGVPCEGQLCPSCKERASQVAMQFRGSGQVFSGFLTGY